MDAKEGGAATFFLKTKLYVPPIRPALVSQPHLIGRLNAGLRRKLTLVSAPAGFGKTTLLIEWISQGEMPVAWLSLDDGDNDPARFWSYFVVALQSVQAGVGEAALEARTEGWIAGLQLAALALAVKKHLKNIYGKLGVHSRTQAVARARDQGLL